MDLFEYEGKQYLAAYGVPTPRGEIADTVDQAVGTSAVVGYPVALKAQVKVGGRGKAGGIRIANNPEEAAECAAAILGLDIKGHVAHRLWIEPTADIAREYYASFTLDRLSRHHMCMLSAQGGVEIEELAVTSPDTIVRLEIDPLDGLSLDAARDFATSAGIDAAAIDQVAATLVAMYDAYEKGDADLVEVNPLVLTSAGTVMALDAKVTLDDSATFRHPEWEPYGDEEVTDLRERLAQEIGLQYVGLDGDVGVIANGAGLAMATCDVVELVGGKPANFLDIGGGANADRMAGALRVVGADDKVRAIFVNIFGGITRCDEVAEGILQALKATPEGPPLVVRLDGTNAAAGRTILESNQNARLVSRPTMLEAARVVVDLARSAS